MEDILKEITPLLGKHGLVIFQSETGRAMFDDENVIAVEYAFTVAHVSGETWPPVRQTGAAHTKRPASFPIPLAGRPRRRQPSSTKARGGAPSPESRTEACEPEEAAFDQA
jgi:hypothetical protein